MTDRSIEELQSRARMAERLIRQLAKSLNAQPLRAPDWMLRQRKHDDHVLLDDIRQRIIALDPFILEPPDGFGDYAARLSPVREILIHLCNDFNGSKTYWTYGEELNHALPSEPGGLPATANSESQSVPKATKSNESKATTKKKRNNSYRPVLGEDGKKCSDAFKSLFNSGEKINLRQHCHDWAGENANLANVKVRKGGTLYNALTHHENRKIWDPEGKYKNV